MLQFGQYFFGCVGFCVSWAEGTDICGVGLSDEARVWLHAAAKVSNKTGSKKRAKTFIAVDTMTQFSYFRLEI